MSATAGEASHQATSVAVVAEQASANVQTVAAATEQLSSSVSEIGRQVTQSTEIAGQAVAEANRTNVTVQGLSAGTAMVATFGTYGVITVASLQPGIGVAQDRDLGWLVGRIAPVVSAMA